MSRIFLFIIAVLASSPALAYIGPGLGAGTIGVILGVLGSIFLALFAIFWYPIKRLLKKKKSDDQEKAPAKQDDDGNSESTDKTG